MSFSFAGYGRRLVKIDQEFSEMDCKVYHLLEPACPVFICPARVNCVFCHVLTSGWRFAQTDCAPWVWSSRFLYFQHEELLLHPFVISISEVKEVRRKCSGRCRSMIGGADSVIFFCNKPCVKSHNHQRACCCYRHQRYQWVLDVTNGFGAALAVNCFSTLQNQLSFNLL